jgi:IrrE N-terminal-like domain
MNWTMANRLGHIAATKAHSRLGVPVSAYPVNVSKAIDDAGLTLMRRPMPRLFGIYIEANGNRGVMVNSIMTRATRRHTAAHELGHHEFEHRPDPARQCTIEATVPAAAGSSPTGAQGRVRAQGQVEMSAEAFAAWFLMPRRAVMAAVAALGIDRVSSPADAYQLSLLLGTTHRATCRHLVNLRMAARNDSDDWVRVPPGRLKRALAAEVGLTLASTFDMDVWDLRTAIRARVEASVGDLLVLPAGAAEAAGLVVVVTSSSTVTVECVAAVSLTDLVSETLAMSLVVYDRPLGLYLPAADPSLGEVELTS